METASNVTQDQAVPAGPPTPPTGRHRLATIWAGLRATVGTLMGLAPHVLHHVGILAGAALLTGALGNTLLYVVGLLLSLPLLNRLRKRYHTWRAPILGVAVFTVLFGLSAFVIGPLLNPSGVQPQPPDAPTPATIDAHQGHHD